MGIASDNDTWALAASFSSYVTGMVAATRAAVYRLMHPEATGS